MQEQRTPRTLPYRFYYKWYALVMAFAWLLSLGTLAILLWKDPSTLSRELPGFAGLLLLLPALYLVWLHPKLTRVVQVYKDHVRVSNQRLSWEISFNDVEKVERPFHSLIRLRMRDGSSWWFSAAMERPDYLWEGLKASRPELMGSPEEYEQFRVELVQYDHHEKRKEWFFRHRLLDVANWVLIPAVALTLSYFWQSGDIIIHNKVMYFFRLAMYALFSGIVCAFLWSFVLKYLVFDKWVEQGLKDGSKIRDLAREDGILQKAKLGQLVTCVLVMMVVVKSDLNMLSVAHIGDNPAFRLKEKTLIVDNRYNCVACRYPLQEGDLVLFGRSQLGRVLAVPGEVIAQSHQTDLGRSIASETVVEVPAGHVALKINDKGHDVVLVRIDDLVGKLKKP